MEFPCARFRKAVGEIWFLMRSCSRDILELVDYIINLNRTQIILQYSRRHIAIKGILKQPVQRKKPLLVVGMLLRIICDYELIMYDEESPRFNEIFVQPSPTKITDYRFDLDRGESDAKELPQDIDRKLIGFESVDELFSAIQQPHPKSEKERPSLHNSPVQERIQQVPPTRRPTITINYSRPSQFSPRNAASPPLGPLFRTVKSPQMRVRKVIQYEERVVRVPIQRQIVQFTAIQEMPEPSETRLQERPSPLSMHRTRSIQAIPPRPNLSIVTRQDRNFIGGLPKEQDQLVRFVTSQGYNYEQRKQQLQDLNKKMQQLREIEQQLFGT